MFENLFEKEKRSTILFMPEEKRSTIVFMPEKKRSTLLNNIDTREMLYARKMLISNLDPIKWLPKVALLNDLVATIQIPKV